MWKLYLNGKLKGEFEDDKKADEKAKHLLRGDNIPEYSAVVVSFNGTVMWIFAMCNDDVECFMM